MPDVLWRRPPGCRTLHGFERVVEYDRRGAVRLVYWRCGCGDWSIDTEPRDRGERSKSKRCQLEIEGSVAA